MSAIARKNVVDAAMAGFDNSKNMWMASNTIKINGRAITYEDIKRNSAALATAMMEELVGENAKFTRDMLNLAQTFIQDFDDLGSPGLASFMGGLARNSPIGFSVFVLALATVYAYNRSSASLIRMKEQPDSRDPWRKLTGAVMTNLADDFFMPKPTIDGDTEKTLNKLPERMLDLCPGELRESNWSFSGPVLLPVLMSGGPTKTAFKTAHEFYIKGSTAFGVLQTQMGSSAAYSEKLMDVDLGEYVARNPGSTPMEKSFAFICQYIREVQGGRNAKSEILRHGPNRAYLNGLLNTMRTSALFKQGIEDRDAPSCDIALGFIDKDGKPLYDELVGEVRRIGDVEELVWTGLSLPMGFQPNLLQPNTKVIEGNAVGADSARPRIRNSISAIIDAGLGASDVSKGEDHSVASADAYLKAHSNIYASAIAGEGMDDKARAALASDVSSSLLGERGSGVALKPPERASINQVVSGGQNV